MSYILKRNMPGLRKGALILWDKKNEKYYAPKDSYIEFYYFTKAEVEGNKKWFKPKPFFTLLMIIFWNFSFCQADTIKWNSGNEVSVSQYLIEYSKDSSNWTVLSTDLPGKTNYSYIVQGDAGFYRVHASGSGDFYKPGVFLSVNSATITYPTFHPTNLTWIVTNEYNVSSYWIQKTRNGITTTVTKYPAKGGGNYKYWMNKTIYKYSYTIRAIYNDLTLGTTQNFQ